MIRVMVTDHESPATPTPGSGWAHSTHLCPEATVRGRTATHVYHKGVLRVLCSAPVGNFQGQAVPQNHTSVSAHPDLNRRATDDELALVRRDFDMVDAEEDNHEPGTARHLFLPLHLPRGVTGVCECKDDEETVIEPDGHRWQRAR